MVGNQVTSAGLDQQQGLYEDGMQYIGSEFTKSLLPMVKTGSWDFPGGLVVKNPPATAEGEDLIPGPGSFHMPRSNYPEYKTIFPSPVHPCMTEFLAKQNGHACLLGSILPG